MPKKRRKFTNLRTTRPYLVCLSQAPTQATPMAEAIAFISALVGEPFDCAHGNSLHWSGRYTKKGSEWGGYPISITHMEDKTLHVVVDVDALSCDAPPSALNRLYAVMGWALSHGHIVQMLPSHL